MNASLPPRPDRRGGPEAPLEVDIRLPLDRFQLCAAFTAAGPVTGLFGPSGAGKTSLLRVLAGLTRAAHGRVALGGEIWQDSEQGTFVPPEGRGLGYVPQDGLLFPHWSVRENLLAGARRARRAGRQPEKELARVAELLELGALLERRVGALSGGERQRVALGRALCSGPRLLLLDEPLAALDLGLRRRLLPFLARVREEATVPMILISHDPIEIQALCDEVVVLAEGEIRAHGEPHRVLSDPAVFPLAGEEPFENVLPATLVSQHAGTAVARVEVHAGREAAGAEAECLEAGGLEIIALASPAAPPAGVLAPGASVLLGITADEILISREEPRGLSARNILPGTVKAIRRVDGSALLEVALGSGPAAPQLTVRITAERPRALGLEVGGRAYLIFKAASCRLYAGAGPSL